MPAPGSSGLATVALRPQIHLWPIPRPLEQPGVVVWVPGTVWSGQKHSRVPGKSHRGAKPGTQGCHGSSQPSPKTSTCPSHQSPRAKEPKVPQKRVCPKQNDLRKHIPGPPQIPGSGPGFAAFPLALKWCHPSGTIPGGITALPSLSSDGTTPIWCHLHPTTPWSGSAVPGTAGSSFPVNHSSFPASQPRPH